MLSSVRFISMGLAFLTGALCAQEAPRPNYITGRTVKSDGSPLAGVKLRVFGTTDAGQRSSLNARSTANGAFSLRLPSGNFSLREAVWPVMHEGRSYALPLYLEGEDNDDFDSTEGWAARLVLLMEGKVSARKSDADESAWFGGTIEIELINSDRTSANALPENATLTLMLTPRGTRFDGTPAVPLTYSRGRSWRRADRFIVNVPLASYEAEATLADGGRQTRLTLASREGVSSAQYTALGRSAPIRFAPKSGEVTLLTTSGVEKCVLQVVVPTRGQPAAAPASTPAPVPDESSEWQVGDHLDVLRTPRLDQWHAGRIIRAKPGLYLIKFDAFGEEHNEWVDASRLRRLDR
ncbi:MAG: carboxypeptidase regulatory-like domain-containing protein [Opitutaceae bacterium]|nr:carboxypeptidase regulatory-like domain-containing protein [Opitutaceae bacterium]